MAKKRGKKVKEAAPKKFKADKSAVKDKAAGALQAKPIEKKQNDASFFSELFGGNVKPKSEYRKNEEEDLRRAEWGVSDLAVERETQKANKSGIPTWFYIVSIFTAFLFTVYMSVYATIHFESIEYMNITIVFLFITMVSYFLISAMYFFSEKKKWHSTLSALFFVGIVLIMVYAFRAVDTSNLVRFSIIYTIIVAAISTYVLAIRR